MAKGLEDTAFYRYYPLASMNEVGGELDAKPLGGRGISPPHAAPDARMAPLAFRHRTHDTKRGEDHRAPPARAVRDCRRVGCDRRPLAEADSTPAARSRGRLGARRNELYLLLQTLVGTWPVDDDGKADLQEYAARISAYMQKALREAKRHTLVDQPRAGIRRRSWRPRRNANSRRAPAPPSARNSTRSPAASRRRATSMGSPRRSSRSRCPASPTSTKATSFGTSTSSTPTTAGPSISRARRTSLDDLQRRLRESPAELAKELAKSLHLDAAQAVRGLARAGHARRARRCLPARRLPPARASPAPIATAPLAFARSFDAKWIAVVVPRQHTMRARRTGRHRLARYGRRIADRRRRVAKRAHRGRGANQPWPPGAACQHARPAAPGTTDFGLTASD